MKHTLLTMTLAAQLAGGAALAQTQGDTDDVNANQSQTNAPDLQPVAYGGDWPQTLVMAMFTQDRLTVRPAEELAMQWRTLAPADQDIIRRDCADVSQLTEAEMLSDDPGEMSDGVDDRAVAGADDTASRMGTGANTVGTLDGEAPADVVTGSPVDGTTGQTGETGTTGDTSVTPFTGDTAPQDDGPAMDSTGTMMSEDDSLNDIEISIAQMQTICTALQEQ
ncbi:MULTISPECIES: hypothetical protein [unclassified Yoonia]|uniref:hypothetical protein n=1 Tax=unclassified Yoonia TaxID=2629118 RepID=UPI002AFEAC41|nr:MULTISPECIES: hypothetical protein [unclassified Yoonia]